MDSRIVRLLLLVIVFIAIALRYQRLGADEPWHDEVFSMLESLGCRFDDGSAVQGFTRADLAVKRTLSNTIAANQIMDSGNGALYAVALHAWSRCFGIAPETYRLFSLAWFIITMMLAYRLAKVLFGTDGSALLTTAALAITMLLLPVDIRPYQMGTAIALACTLQLAQALRSPLPGWPRIGLYAFLATASVLTHFSTVYVLLAHPIIALIHRAPASTWRRLAIGGAISTAAVVLWLSTIGQQGLETMAQRNAHYADLVRITPEPGTFFRATNARTLIEGIALQGAWAMSDSLLSTGLRLRTVAALMAIPWLLIALTYREPVQHGDRRGIASLSALMIMALAYAAALALISGHTVSFMAYYATFVTPYWAILVGHVTWTAAQGGVRNRPLRIILALGTWAVLIASVLSPPPKQPIAPNEYALQARRFEAAAERYHDCKLTAVHSSWTAACLSAWYSNERTANLHNYVVPSYRGISGLVVECGQNAWLVPIRERDQRYGRSEPRDVETWSIDHAGAPILPDSIDAWRP